MRTHLLALVPSVDRPPSTRAHGLVAAYGAGPALVITVVITVVIDATVL